MGGCQLGGFSPIIVSLPTSSTLSGVILDLESILDLILRESKWTVKYYEKFLFQHLCFPIVWARGEIWQDKLGVAGRM